MSRSAVPSDGRRRKWLRAWPPAARFVFRGAAAHVGLPARLSASPSPYSHVGRRRMASRAALWLGPDECLLLAADAEGVGARRRAAVCPARKAYSLVDVSHRQIGYPSGAPRRVAARVAMPAPPTGGVFPVGHVYAHVAGQSRDRALADRGGHSFRYRGDAIVRAVCGSNSSARDRPRVGRLSVPATMHRLPALGPT